MSIKKASQKTLCLAVAISLTGCATGPNQQGGIVGAIHNAFNNEDPCSNNARNLGILIGTVAGAALGTAASNDKKGLLIGAAGGAVIGGLIGSNMDRRRCELSKIAKQYDLDLKMSTITDSGDVMDDAALKSSGNADALKKSSIGMVVSVRDQAEAGGHFEPNSDVLTPRAREYFSAIANSYNSKKTAEQIANPKDRAEYLRQTAQRKLLLIGHTDDTGSSRLNANLSERRAKAVAQFLEQQGIPRDSIYYQGAGEIYPIADNNTEAGRAQNRRVEIVELTDDSTFQKYLTARKPHYEFYRAEAAPVPSTSDGTIEAAAPKQKSRASVATRSPATTTKPATSVAKAAPLAANPATPVATPAIPVIGKSLDFGGTPMVQANASTNIGKLETKKPWFSLVSTAYANEPAVFADCSKDRPRSSGAVHALKDGAVYKTSEHVRGLYGKSWTDLVNGHRIIINKVAVLANEATLAQIPEFKVYANYDPKINRNPAPDVVVAPEVNTYLGSNGILYRIFTNGNGGMQCVDILFDGNGSAHAKAGKLVYAHDAQLYVADFKPSMIN
jgi:outer membrane protein OmpA-like peptidoglycan-associated protein